MKPQLIVRKQGEVYVAEFNPDFFKDEMQPVFHGPDFQGYLTQGRQVEEDLELIASAAMPFRSYSVIEGEYSVSKSNHVARRKNIAGVHSGILGEAEKIAEQQRAPYFGLVVIAQSGDFPGKPTDADRDMNLPYSSLDYRVYDLHQNPIDKGLSNLKDKDLENLNEMIPFKLTWTLHPTVNLYVPKGEQ